MCILCLPTVLLPGQGCTKRVEDLKKLNRKVVRSLFERIFGTVCCIFGSAQLLKLEDTYRVKVAGYTFNTVKLGKSKTLMNDLDILQSCLKYSI